MFRINQIMSANAFIRSFKEVAEYLSQNPEPLLITQRNGRFIVIMDGEFFEGLMDARRRCLEGISGSENSVEDALKAQNDAF